MAELITLNPNQENVTIDYRLFTEVLEYKGNNRERYLRFLRDTLPRFILKQRETKPGFCFLMAEHQVSKLKAVSGQDAKLDDTLQKYKNQGYLRTFETDKFLTQEQMAKVDLTRKEEQAYYVKLMELIGQGYNNVQFKQMLLTGPKHAKKCADGVIDAGVARVGSFDLETTYVEYKIVEPEIGEKVYIDDMAFTLAENMSTGGEAKLFYLKEDPEQNFIAKIYSTSITEDLPNCVKFQYLMRQREKKLDMIFNEERYSKVLESEEQIIFPIKPIYDVNENLIGVLMQNVKAENGKVYQLHSIIKNKQYPYPNFDRLDLINIAEQIIRILRKLHNSNIIVGDINLRNFLVTGDSKETLKVYVIDLDGCQIPEFPSYYETVGYRDPLWDVSLKKPRTIENEIYALLVLMFEIFHFVHPFQYNYKKGKGNSVINDFQLNMQNRDFPYVQGDLKAKEKENNINVKNKDIKSPPTKANYIFSYMYKPLKEMFIQTFGKQDYRPTIDEVLSLVKRYKKSVENDLEGGNHLEFNTFAISPKNRATFKCSHRDCTKEHTYVHINQVLNMLSKQVNNPYYKANQLFCGEHVQWFDNIKSFEKKNSGAPEELAAFRKEWQAQIKENDLVEIAKNFFEKNPTHLTKSAWDSIQQQIAQKEAPKPGSKPTTVVKKEPTQINQPANSKKLEQPQKTGNIIPPKKQTAMSMWKNMFSNMANKLK